MEMSKKKKKNWKGIGRSVVLRRVEGPREQAQVHIIYSLHFKM
jgi:hypothetical protein